MLKLSTEMKMTSSLDCVTAMCREGWVVMHRPLNIPGAVWVLRKLETDGEADCAAAVELRREAAECDYMLVSPPFDVFSREEADAMSADGGVCVFEEKGANGKVFCWRMCRIWGGDF